MTSERLAAAVADRYRIERELGACGMATVYLAHDIRHDRNVAIKVLKPELAAVLGTERFVVEIRTTAALSHPRIRGGQHTRGSRNEPTLRAIAGTDAFDPPNSAPRRTPNNV